MLLDEEIYGSGLVEVTCYVMNKQGVRTKKKKVNIVLHVRRGFNWKREEVL
jgi:hypothetical protein